MKKLEKKHAWLIKGKTNFLICVGEDFHPNNTHPNDFIFRTVLFNIPEDKIILPVNFYISECLRAFTEGLT